ncbi:MAG TPA: copper chaperone PCu(A)C [Cellvibrio sp.]|nr:copper chaperone PCu(A)C [Cellvibrio sp.]
MRNTMYRVLVITLFFMVGSAFAGQSDPTDVPAKAAKTQSDPVKVATQVRVDGAYINVPVPGTKNTAAYFTLRNLADKPVSLVSVEVDVAQRAELHSHTTKDGMMQMRREEKILIPAQSSVAFASGSYHVMLFDLQRSIRTGEELQLLLTFADGKQLVATAKVKSIFDKAHHH